MTHLVPSSNSITISKQRQKFVPDANFSFVGLWRAPVRWHGYRQNMKLWWCCDENWNASLTIKRTYFNIKVLLRKSRTYTACSTPQPLFSKINSPTRIRKAQPESFGLDLCSTNSCPSRIPPNPVRFSHPQARGFSGKKWFFRSSF